MARPGPLDTTRSGPQPCKLFDPVESVAFSGGIRAGPCGVYVLEGRSRLPAANTRRRPPATTATAGRPHRRFCSLDRGHDPSCLEPPVFHCAVLLRGRAAEVTWIAIRGDGLPRRGRERRASCASVGHAGHRRTSLFIIETFDRRRRTCEESATQTPVLRPLRLLHRPSGGRPAAHRHQEIDEHARLAGR